MCAALFALSSCTNEIIEDGFVDKSNTISFNSSTPKSRAYTSGDVAKTTTLQEGNFGVVGYSNNALYLGTTSKAAEQTYADGNWKYADPDETRYWPNNAMDFYAYFPFAANGDVFAAANNTSDKVMTITNTSGNQDVLFASALGQARVDRVDLQFHHAFAKIGGINIQIKNKDVTVEVNKVELINTFTKGQVLVDVNGKASYGTHAESRAKDISPVTITKGNTFDVSETTYQTLVDNNDNAYIFATNGTEMNFVTGTGTALWDGTNTSWVPGKTLETLGQVCLKLTCKVSTPSSAGVCYHVGGAGADSYGVMYIPISGSKITSINPNDANKTALLAGKRYTYNIIMENNVGFNDKGEAILLPILFKSTSVDSWDDVTVTITL